MRLLFVHQPKTAGTTFRKIFSQNKTQLSLASVPSDVPPKEIFNMIQAHDITHFMAFDLSFKKRLGEYWDELLTETIFISIIRNPIELFESEWRFQFQIKHTQGERIHHIPFDPIFNKEKLGCEPGINSMCDYLEREPNKQLDINEWFEIILDIEREALKGDNPYSDRTSQIQQYRFPIAHDTKNLYWYFNNPLYLPGWDPGLFNRQYLQLEQHFSSSFFGFLDKPDTAPQLILLPTEILDNALASYITLNKSFREFTIFNDLPDDQIYFNQIVSGINNLRQNVTDENYRKDPKGQLSAKNRLLYYRYSTKDYKLWTSSLYRSLYLIHKLSSAKQ